MTFDPNKESSYEDGIFGVPTNYEDAGLIFLPVPWEVTTSYGDGTSNGPQIILEESDQLDLFDRDFSNLQLSIEQPFEFGFYMQEVSDTLLTLNKEHKKLAQSPSIENIKKINLASQKLNSFVYQQSQKILSDNKLCAVIGGDHSTPMGLIQTLSEKHNGDFTILHIDAHHDLRKSYQGYEHSHASIMHNVMSSSFAPQNLISIGIRDFCEEEFLFARDHKDIHTFYDSQISEDMIQGKNWAKITQEILSLCHDNIYISCDIDGLSPDLCPNTGTPVPGGLDFAQFNYLLKNIVSAKKTIIGFDLVEVSAGSNPSSNWDANVGARVLYKMATCLATTQLLKLAPESQNV